MSSEAFVRAVREASARPDVVEAVGGVYRELAGRIELRKPVCRASGRCCRFEEFGHRLYVTTVEMAAFVAQLPAVKPQAAGGGLPIFKENPGGCPFQEGGLCTAHLVRPFGCRVFFCDETSTEWQQAQYEELHAGLKRLHEELGVAYYYVEWREALRQLGLSRP